MEYQIIVKDNVDDLVNSMNEHINNGWSMLGGHQHTVAVYKDFENEQVVRGSWSQAMTRERK